jgi:ankyrin repeat protein
VRACIPEVSTPADLSQYLGVKKILKSTAYPDHAGLVVKETLELGILGVFTDQDIPKDTVIAEYLGKKITLKTGAELPEEQKAYACTLSTDGGRETLLLGHDERNIGPMINANFGSRHKVPGNTNCKYKVSDDKRHILIVTTGLVRKGSQLLVCYGPQYQLPEGVSPVSFNPYYSADNHALLDTNKVEELNVGSHQAAMLGISGRALYRCKGKKHAGISPAVMVNLPLFENVAPRHYVTQKGITGTTGLMYLCSHSEFKGMLEALQAILDRGADPNIGQIHTGHTPFYFLLRNTTVSADMRFEMAKILIKAGADLTVEDAKGWDLLAWSLELVRAGEIDSFKMFALILESDSLCKYSVYELIYEMDMTATFSGMPPKRAQFVMAGVLAYGKLYGMLYLDSEATKARMRDFKKVTGQVIDLDSLPLVRRATTALVTKCPGAMGLDTYDAAEKFLARYVSKKQLNLEGGVASLDRVFLAPYPLLGRDAVGAFSALDIDKGCKLGRLEKKRAEATWAYHMKHSERANVEVTSTGDVVTLCHVSKGDQLCYYYPDIRLNKIAHPLYINCSDGWESAPKNKDAVSELSKACAKGLFPSVRWHLAHGKNPNEMQIKTGKTPLFYALDLGNDKKILRKSIIEALLKNGADTHHQLADGTSVLHVCIDRFNKDHDNDWIDIMTMIIENEKKRVRQDSEAPSVLDLEADCVLKDPDDDVKVFSLAPQYYLAALGHVVEAKRLMSRYAKLNSSFDMKNDFREQRHNLIDVIRFCEKPEDVSVGIRRCVRAFDKGSAAGLSSWSGDSRHSTRKGRGCIRERYIELKNPCMRPEKKGS